ncbi:hypothetical protein N7491_008474 [Penicillium cf. griseofulvum]|uniref:protein acetyllysine N-acetyltransferase n=1 Tax=Penicillium cf. griseofulvum TaxID=2972120 RepID=A0A9W9SW19_9EURO|nr:hypothetical protein N7472_005924 [Penicillium cf. griseofulvum]KAJ5423258.1 hypothetical protein N7491_008474 [Penicillium cf. griseofulvum]KAJ5431470.1 hypothetical protein N7445_009202 [Penicillium cf. griseofulvum]
MTNNAPKVAAKEIREPLTAVDKKAEALAAQIKKSKHFIVFTGAGVSTSAGIPDFRGPEGNWTLRAQGKKQTKVANTLQAIPTPSHMALVELQNQGILKHLISQNCDGLRRRSGILPKFLYEMISELHGNSNHFRAVSTYERGDHDHRTGRKCARCGGILLDSIVNFDEQLPARDFDLGRENARNGDFCLVLGSSLTVIPANEIPKIVGEKKGAKLAICNLQKTPIDELCDYRIFAEADTLMIKVVEKLGLSIPPFILRRRLVVNVETQEEDRHRVTVTGIDSDGTPVTFLQSVRLEGGRRVAREEPYVIHLRESLQPGAQLKLELEFMGHYNEPNLELVHDYNGDEPGLYILEYNPQNRAWVIRR